MMGRDNKIALDAEKEPNPICRSGKVKDLFKQR